MTILGELLGVLEPSSEDGEVFHAISELVGPQNTLLTCDGVATSVDGLDDDLVEPFVEVGLLSDRNVLLVMKDREGAELGPEICEWVTISSLPFGDIRIMRA